MPNYNNFYWGIPKVKKHIKISIKITNPLFDINRLIIQYGEANKNAFFNNGAVEKRHNQHKTGYFEKQDLSYKARFYKHIECVLTDIDIGVGVHEIREASAGGVLCYFVHGQ